VSALCNSPPKRGFEIRLYVHNSGVGVPARHWQPLKGHPKANHRQGRLRHHDKNAIIFDIPLCLECDNH
jgi:hypothetical protein